MVPQRPDVGAVPDLGHREAAGELDAGDLRQVRRVVPLGAEPVDRPAGEPELHAHLDQQRQVTVREGLEARDGAGGVVLAAVGGREAERTHARTAPICFSHSRTWSRYSSRDRP